MANLPAVRQYMDTKIHTLKPDQGILEAIDFLIEHHVTGAPVLDAAGQLIGILTERDCLQVLSMGSGGDPAVGSVRDFMTAKVVSIPPEMNIYYAAGIFLHHNFRRLPVVDKGQLIGAITRFDILKAVSLNHKLVAGDD